MGRETQLLSKSIGESFDKARTAEQKFGHLLERQTSESIDDPENYELFEADETLAYWINEIFRDLAILAELLGLPLLATRIVKAVPKKNLTAMSSSPGDVEQYSEALIIATGFYDSIATIAEGGAVTGISVFETILKNTPAIIRAKGIKPKSEAEVRTAIYEILRFSFHDAVREIPLSQILKVYKPDLGVRSLMAAAEYKFCDSEAEVKKALDEIYADMKGYSGHDEWRTFFAVIYTTDAIVHQDELEADFRGVKADINWTPIILVGRGGRVRRPQPRRRLASAAPS